MRLMSRGGGAVPGWLVALSVTSLLVTLPHSFEDFVAGVPEDYGLTTLSAGGLLALVYAVQVVGILLASRRVRLGYWLHLLIGLFWLFGSIYDHLDDVLLAHPYRAGLPSKALEVGIMAVSAGIVTLSALALRGGRGTSSG
ncbi:MAG: hypothetical protein M3Q29_22160 [Chloroflexota bacterium]|nr:hypothetical protein [Chloroflexota bacterium]